MRLKYWLYIIFSYYTCRVAVPSSMYSILTFLPAVMTELSGPCHTTVGLGRPHTWHVKVTAVPLSAITSVKCSENTGGTSIYSTKKAYNKEKTKFMSIYDIIKFSWQESLSTYGGFGVPLWRLLETTGWALILVFFQAGLFQLEVPWLAESIIRRLLRLADYVRGDPALSGGRVCVGGAVD